MIRRVKHKIIDFLPALKSSNYRLYFVGQGISLIGTWLATVAEQWLIYPTLTDNKSLIGVVTAINLIPTAALLLFAGVLADRVDRRKANMYIQILFGLISFTLSVLIFAKTIQVWHVMIAAFLSGVIFAFDLPTRMALTLQIVEKKEYPSALALNGGIFNAARAIGPAIAGLMIASVGIGAAYLLNAFSYVAVIFSYLLMKVTHIPSNLKKHEHIIRDLKVGLRFAKQNTSIVLLLLIIGSYALCTMMFGTLFAIYAHDIFRTGEIGFGLLQSALGVGSVIGAFSFSKLFEKIVNKIRILWLSILVTIFITTIFALSNSFYINLLILFIGGIANSLVYSCVSTFIQLQTPDNLRGRLMSMNSFMIFSSLPAGSLLTSITLQIWQPQTITILSSVLLLILSGSIWLAGRKKFTTSFDLKNA